MGSPVEELAIRVAESRGADRDAVEDLCSALWPRLRLVLRRTERDADAADDLAQETVLEVLDALVERRIEDPRRVVAFAQTAAHRAAASAGRLRRRREELMARFGFVAPAETPTYERVDLDALGRCMAKLPFRERQVVFEGFLLGREAERIAATLKTTAGNVRVLRYRALESLRRCLGLEEAR